MSTTTKSFYTFLFGVVNLLTYFWIQSYVGNEYSFMTPVDKAIPFMPEFVWIYHTIIPVIFITMIILVKNRKVFMNTLWACVMATFIIHLFYLIFPSFYPRPEFIPQNLSERLVELSYMIDNSSNTFPSGHVAFSWLMFFGASHSELAKKHGVLKRVYLLWAIGVTISTLAIKMHYIVDLFGGFAIAGFCFFFIKYMYSKNIFKKPINN